MSAGSNDDEFDDGEFTPAETRRLRRMLHDDYYARKLRVVLKVWVVTVGSVAAAMVALMALWKEFIGRIIGD